MTDTNRLYSMMEFEEGSKEGLYLCSAKKLTIGIGCNIEDSPLTGSQLRELYDNHEIAITLTKSGQKRSLGWRLTEAEQECRARFAFWHRLNDARQNVLISMAFQLGIARLLLFKDMLSAIGREDWDAAETEGLDSKWAKIDSTARAKRHMRQIKTGEFQ